tara:strand:- start:53 stop:262 length:210 start_codon:yes stop_codon:yes gene_type:complete
MKHLDENNETYCSHLKFASKIAVQLYLSSVFFAAHAVFPCWDIPSNFDLNATCKKIQKWNDHAKQRKNK